MASKYFTVYDDAPDPPPRVFWEAPRSIEGGWGYPDPPPPSKRRGSEGGTPPSDPKSGVKKFFPNF